MKIGNGSKQIVRGGSWYSFYHLREVRTTIQEELFVRDNNSGFRIIRRSYDNKY